MQDNLLKQLPSKKVLLLHPPSIMNKIILSFFALISYATYAYESDQFSVPKHEIADVGEDISMFILEQTKEAVLTINNDLKEYPLKIEELKKRIDKLNPRTRAEKITELKRKLSKYTKYHKGLYTKEGIVAVVHKKIGGEFAWQDQRDGVFGLPLSIIPYPDNIKDNKPITYLPSSLKTIYSFSGFHRIISPTYFVFCSSLKMYGVYLGIDKLGHMFNQGHQYYEIYQSALTQNNSHEEALTKAIEWGKSTENGKFGMVADGVYSNGDLAANFAGFHFYDNLFNSITIGDKTYSPILTIKEDNTVEIDTTIDGKTFVAPFISHHLNEALNPSHFEKLQRSIIKSAIKKRCKRIMNFYKWDTAAEWNEITDSLKTWHGKEYSHRSDKALRIDELCF